MKRLCLTFATFLLAMALFAQSYQQWIDRSYLAVDGKDWAAAEDCLLKALRTEPANPQNGWVLSNMATMQRNQGKRLEAYQSYTNGLLFAPKSVVILLNRAALQLEMDSIAGALQDYNTVLSLDQENKEALVARGEIYVTQRDTVLAKKDFEKALSIDKNILRASEGIALINKLSGKYQEAEKSYNHLLSQRPDDISLLFNRAELYLMWHKYPKAMADVNRLIVLQPKEPINYFLRGKINYAMYERKMANFDFTKAKEFGYKSEELDLWIKRTK